MNCLRVLLCTALISTAPRTVRVYTDAGAARDCVAHTVRALRSALGPAYAVETCNAAQLRGDAIDSIDASPWEAETALLVLPGGRDLPYLEKLGARGAARIRAFVQGGGAYLGLCAGGYFGAADIEFFADFSGDAAHQAQAIVGERPLKFFPGRCVGPVWRDFVYDSEQGAHAAWVHPEPGLAARTGGDFVLYQNGGGAFVNAEGYPNTRVILRYAAGSSHAAAVLTQVGAGRALLTGVHPEFDAAYLPVTDYAPGVRAALQAAAPQRCQAWAYMLTELGLPASAAACLLGSAY